MRLPLKQGWQLVKQAVKAWSDDYAPSMGAALVVLHPVLHRAAAPHRDLGRRFHLRRRGGARRAHRRPAGPDGRGRRQGDRRPAGERERAEGGHHRHRGRHLRAAARCDHGVRRAAERARPHLARAGARGRERPVAAAALAAAVARHDPRHRVPADGLAGVRRGAAGAGQGLGHRRAGGVRAGAQPAGRLSPSPPPSSR